MSFICSFTETRDARGDGVASRDSPALPFEPLRDPVHEPFRDSVHEPWRDSVHEPWRDPVHEPLRDSVHSSEKRRGSAARAE